MTDIVTGNQIDIAAFDSGMSSPLLGSRAADWVEDRGRDVVRGLQQASQDQEGIGDDILRGAGSVLQGAGAVMNAPVIKQGMQALDAASYYGGKLGGNLAKSIGVDPRIGGLAGNLVGDAVTGGLIRKAPKIAGKLSDQAASFAAKNIPARTVYADSAVLPKGIEKIKIAGRYKDHPDFLKELAKKTKFSDDYISKHGSLGSYKGENKFIQVPDGDTYQYMVKDGRMSWKNRTTQIESMLKRTHGQRPDTKSIMPLMEKHVGSKHAEAATQLYAETNTKVFKEVDNALKRFNKKIKSQPNWDKKDLLSLEHIFDVHFYHRLKELTPKFTGRGANEAGNITAMNNVLNMRTGAMNKKISTHDALIKNIQSGKGFPDYNKSVGEFIEYDVGNKVKNFTKDQWDDFLQQVLQKEGTDAQEILIDMIKTDDLVEDVRKMTIRS